MEKEKHFFTPYVEQVDEHGVKVRDFDDHISILRQEAQWGGEPEIVALSGAFNCLFEVYKTSESPDLRFFPNVIGNTNPTIRLFYRNNHYNIVRSDNIGDQLFNFEGLEDGELQRQNEILSTSKDPKNTVIMRCIPLLMINLLHTPYNYHLMQTRQRRTTNDFMLQGSLNGIQTSRMNRP